MSHKQQFDENTETSMFLGMLADKSKMNPETKEVKIEKITEEANESELANGIGARISAKTFTSSESSQSSITDSDTDSRSTTSSRRSSSSSGSSRRSRRSHTSSVSHSNMNNYINRFNQMNGNQDTPVPKQPEKRVEDVPYVSERDKKIHRMRVFFALEDMKENGVKLTKKYTIDSNLEEMEDELALQSDRENRKGAIAMGKDGILKAVQWIERGNKYFDPIGARLNGWHRQMSTNINNYDPALGKFYDKHKHLITRIEPEIQIPLMIAASGFAFHCTQKYVEEHGLQELVKERPDVLNKIQSAIAGVVETNIGAEQVQKEEKKPELTQQQLYQRMQQMKQQTNQENNVDNTINEMLGSQTYVAPQTQPMNVPIQKPRHFNQLATGGPTISLNTETSRPHNVMIETVDSESVADTGMTTSQKRLRNRIKVTKNTS